MLEVDLGMVLSILEAFCAATTSNWWSSCSGIAICVKVIQKRESFHVHSLEAIGGIAEYWIDVTYNVIRV